MMEVKRVKIKEDAFAPFALKVQVDTLDEACDLWHRLGSVSHSVLRGEVEAEDESDTTRPPLPSGDRTMRLFGEINDILREQGIIE